MPKRKKHAPEVAEIKPHINPVREYLLPSRAADCMKATIAGDDGLKTKFRCGCLRCAPRHWCVDCLKAGKSIWVDAGQLPDLSQPTRCRHCLDVESGRVVPASMREIIGTMDPKTLKTVMGKMPLPRAQPLPEIDVLERAIAIQSQYINTLRLQLGPKVSETMPIADKWREMQDEVIAARRRIAERFNAEGPQTLHVQRKTKKRKRRKS